MYGSVLFMKYLFSFIYVYVDILCTKSWYNILLGGEVEKFEGHCYELPVMSI